MSDAAPLFGDSSLDLAGMRRRNLAGLQAELDTQGIDALWLLGPGHLRYLVGSSVLPCDGARQTWLRSSLVVSHDSDFPHLFTPTPEGAPPELPADFVHPPLCFETDAGVAAAVRSLCDVLGAEPEVLGIDEFSAPLFLQLGTHLPARIVDAAPIIAARKICKSAEEIECIRRAQSINERAMHDVQAALRPGLRQCDLSAIFFSRIYELGASANGIDPIWQVMAPRISDGPWTTHGGVAFPTCTSDRLLREGDLLWVDTGIESHGYQSDFGRTFLVGREPDARQRSHCRRWLEVVEAVLAEVRPGGTGRDLTRCAIEVAGGEKPWLDHFYLIHGVGSEAAEQPLIGTDLGDAFDENLVLAPGMVLVLEPVIWDDGHGGYRSEEIVAVTEDGYQQLSRYPYAPFDAEGTP